MAESCEVLLDTNFLTIPQQFKLDIITEIKCLVPNADLVAITPVARELEKLKEGAIGRQMIEKGQVRLVEYESECTDKAIIEYALKNKAIVATNDKELKEQLRRLNVPVIYLRERQKLELQGAIE